MVPWVADAQTWEFTYVGPQAVELLGFPVEDWYDPSFWIDQVHSEDREHAVSTCTRLTEEGGSYEFEYRMARSDGEVIWVNDIVSVEMGDSGPVTCRGFFIDITEQKALSRSVKESETRFKELVEEVPEATLYVRRDGTIVRTNRLAEAMFGYSEEELVGSSIEDLMPERFSADHSKHRESFSENPRTIHMGERTYLQARRHDGSEFPVEIGLSLFDDRGNLHYLVTVRDLTAQRHIEAELRASERLLRQMVNSVPALVAFVDTEQRYRYVNNNYSNWFDLDPTQMVGKTAREVMGDEPYALMRPKIEGVLRGESQHSEVAIPLGDGTTQPVEVTHVPQFDDDDVVTGYFVISWDVSDRVNAQAADRDYREELAHFSRVATMGELASSIAHELNQPLAAITANAQAASRFLTKTPPDLTEVGDALEDIAGDAKRAANVIRHMRGLLRKGKRLEESVDAVSLVAETVEMLASDAVARNCSMTVKSEGAIPLLTGDPIQLKQVVINLVVNAFDAVSEENGVPGALAITTSTSNGLVEISICDNGSGLPDDPEKDWFAPFVTTKPEGLGMGLSISRSIVEAHGGKLLAESCLEGGANLRILLPVRSGEKE